MILSVQSLYLLSLPLEINIGLTILCFLFQRRDPNFGKNVLVLRAEWFH